MRTKWPISPMFGPLPATLPHAIRTGSWLAREALTNAASRRRRAAAFCVIAVVMSLASLAAQAARIGHGPRPAHIVLPEPRPLPYPRLDLPFEISGGQYAPVA